jgi:hypothetical protein
MEMTDLVPTRHTFLLQNLGENGDGTGMTRSIMMVSYNRWKSAVVFFRVSTTGLNSDFCKDIGISYL